VSRRHHARHRTHRILFLPLILAALCLAGLVVGLLGDGAWDVLASVGIALPIVVATWRWRRASRAP
jgi:CHASE2 domain-containing sensor protein